MKTFQKLFLKYCQPYRWLIGKLFGLCRDDKTLHIPWSIYGDFDVHYLGYDANGYVHKGFRTLKEAIRNKGNLGLTVMFDEY